MSYTKHTWVNGEIITADKLNNLENRIGYEIKEQLTTVFEGSLTTSSSGYAMPIISLFSPSLPLESDSIIISIDGTEYELPKVITNKNYGYGEFDNEYTYYDKPVFTNYPCGIAIFENDYGFMTPQEGTYEVVIKTNALQADVSENFEMAIKQGIADISNDSGCFVITISNNNTSVDRTYSEIQEAINNGKIIVVKIVDHVGDIHYRTADSVSYVSDGDYYSVISRSITVTAASMLIVSEAVINIKSNASDSTINVHENVYDMTPAA